MKLKKLLVFIIAIAVACSATGCFSEPGQSEEEKALEAEVEKLRSEINRLEMELEEAGEPDPDMIFCDICFSEAPEDLMYINDGFRSCPNCVYEEFEILGSEEIGKCRNCGSFYWVSDTSGVGYCYNCEKEYAGSCFLCGCYADWETDDGEFAICDECSKRLFSYETPRDFVRQFEGD